MAINAYNRYHERKRLAKAVKEMNPDKPKFIAPESQQKVIQRDRKTYVLVRKDKLNK